MRDNRIKSTVIIAAMILTISGCTQEDDNRIDGVLALESIGAELNVRTRAHTDNPTMSSVADRAGAGHILTVGLGDQSEPYVYNSGRWVPDKKAVEFPGYLISEIALTLAPDGETVQDGSLKGILDADQLEYSAEISPTNELYGIQMTHAKTMIQIELEGDLYVDNETFLKVGAANAYNIPLTKHFQAIIEPGIDGFDITLTKDGYDYVIHTSKSQVTGGEFLANNRYMLTLTHVGKEVMVKSIVLEPWGEAGAGEARQVTTTTIGLGESFITGTPVKVYYTSGAVGDMMFNDLSDLATGTVFGIESDVVKSISVGGAGEIIIGRLAGETINIVVTSDGSGIARLRKDPATQAYLVGTVEEFRLVDDQLETDSFIQEADIYMMSLPWTPLFDHRAAPPSYFRGTFDGNSKKIHDIVCNDGLSGLFRGNNGGTIKNVNIESGSFGGTGYINCGSICAYNLSGRIENCVNKAVVKADNWLGGICAINEGEVVDCVNRGDVTSIVSGYSSGAYAGGIVGMNGDPGYTSARVEGCVNYGTVMASAYYVGGIAASNYEGTIVDCINEGSVSGDIFVGGISSSNTNDILNCANNGNVTASGQPGGIVGTGFENSYIEGCTNNGEISSTSIGSAGGIIANASANGIVIVNCINNGSVLAVSSNAGGIVGYFFKGEVAACVNTGNVTSNGAWGMTSVGGIAAESGVGTSITACYNRSSGLSSWGYSGGISGSNYGTITACYSTATYIITGNASGGIASRNGDTGTINDCYWVGGYIAKAVGNDGNAGNTTAFQFSAADWPSDEAAKSWGVGNDYANGYYWRFVGSYDTSIYPELYWKGVTRSGAPGKDRAVSRMSADRDPNMFPKPNAVSADISR